MEADVGIAEVTSLTDRRKIGALEAQVGDLTDKLARALDRAQPGLTKALGNECYHHGTFQVSDTKLEVTCKLCGALQDPYAVLRKIAHREVNFCYQLNGLRDEAQRLALETKRAKATLARVKSQTSKAVAKVDCSVDELDVLMNALDANQFVVSRLHGAMTLKFYASRMPVLTTKWFKTLRAAVLDAKAQAAEPRESDKETA